MGADPQGSRPACFGRRFGTVAAVVTVLAVITSGVSELSCWFALAVLAGVSLSGSL